MSITTRLALRVGLAGLAGMLLALPLTVAAAAAPPNAGVPACEMHQLPVPPGVTHSQVTGGDHTGRYLAGEAVTPDGTRIALAWVDGRVRAVDLSAIQPYVGIFVRDVNSHGVVIGYRITDTTRFHQDAWMYRAGHARVLPALHPGDDTEAVAINARGDIVGTDRGFVDGVYRQWAVLWSVDRPNTVRELPLVGETADAVRGIDIDDDGTILGLVGYQPTEQQHPYVWPPRGGGYPLTAPPGTGYPGGEAIHDGRVVGGVMVWADGMGSNYLARWDLRTRTAEMLGVRTSNAIGISRQGTIAISHELVYPDGTVLPLGGPVAVLSDRHTAAGADADSLLGNAVVWTGC